MYCISNTMQYLCSVVTSQLRVVFLYNYVLKLIGMTCSGTQDPSSPTKQNWFVVSSIHCLQLENGWYVCVLCIVGY